MFRLLVGAGADGLPAGRIADALGVASNTLSAQLNVLSHAGLILGVRDGRSIIYTANFAAVTALIVFLMEDCCQGRTDVCAPVIEAAQAACC